LLVESVGDLRFDDIVAYYNQELKNRPIIITIVGDPGSIDMKKLKEIGPVTVVKKKNLFVN
jgi:zinc protease